MIVELQACCGVELDACCETKEKAARNACNSNVLAALKVSTKLPPKVYFWLCLKVKIQSIRQPGPAFQLKLLTHRPKCEYLSWAGILSSWHAVTFLKHSTHHESWRNLFLRCLSRGMWWKVGGPGGKKFTLFTLKQKLNASHHWMCLFFICQLPHFLSLFPHHLQEASLLPK